MATTTATTPTHLTPTPSPPLFSKLGPRISLYTPESHACGELIILCSWLGAAHKHISKYTTAYRSIAPHAKILLIQSDVSSITSPYASQRKAIMPAVEVVRAVLDESTTSSQNDIEHTQAKILLHTFSTGGPISATALLLALHSISHSSQPLPFIGTIMDSGPAAGYYWKSYNAMILSLHKGPTRTLGYVFVHGILLGLFASVAMGRYEYPEVLVRRTLLDEAYVSAGVKRNGEGKQEEEGRGKGRICYVYSKEDQMTDWHDVVEHADIAREKGWEVREWRVEGTAHCNHFKGNEEKYVGWMGVMWEGEPLT
jgi:hypothetical protein